MIQLCSVTGGCIELRSVSWVSAVLVDASSGGVLKLTRHLGFQPGCDPTRLKGRRWKWATWAHPHGRAPLQCRVLVPALRWPRLLGAASRSGISGALRGWPIVAVAMVAGLGG